LTRSTWDWWCCRWHCCTSSVLGWVTSPTPGGAGTWRPENSPC